MIIYVWGSELVIFICLLRKSKFLMHQTMFIWKLDEIAFWDQHCLQPSALYWELSILFRNLINAFSSYWLRHFFHLHTYSNSTLLSFSFHLLVKVSLSANPNKYTSQRYFFPINLRLLSYTRSFMFFYSFQLKWKRILNKNDKFQLYRWFCQYFSVIKYRKDHIDIAEIHSKL